MHADSKHLPYFIRPNQCGSHQGRLFKVEVSLDEIVDYSLYFDLPLVRLEAT
jgi:hypothetical protein